MFTSPASGACTKFFIVRDGLAAVASVPTILRTLEKMGRCLIGESCGGPIFRQ